MEGVWIRSTIGPLDMTDLSAAKRPLSNLPSSYPLWYLVVSPSPDPMLQTNVWSVMRNNFGSYNSEYTIWGKVRGSDFLCVQEWRSLPVPCFVIVVQSLSHVQLFSTPWTAAHQVSLPITISRSLLKLMSIESVMPSNHLIVCCPLLLLPSIFPSISLF